MFAMGFAERGEAHRATWRSLSQRENAKIIYYTHFQHHEQMMFAVICRTLRNFAFRRDANFRFRKFAYENSER